jgi:hypothetical protein
LTHSVVAGLIRVDLENLVLAKGWDRVWRVCVWRWLIPCEGFSL